MLTVTAQINNGDSCPKRENRAWYHEETTVNTLTEAILWLLEMKAVGFTIVDEATNTELAEFTAVYYEWYMEFFSKQGSH